MGLIYGGFARGVRGVWGRREESSGDVVVVVVVVVAREVSMFGVWAGFLTIQGWVLACR